MRLWTKACLLFVVAACSGSPESGDKSGDESGMNDSHILVDTIEAYKDAAKAVQPGETIVLANRVWRDFEVVLNAQGTKDQPVGLVAQTPGKVILSGQSNLRIGGSHITVSGLVFRDGFSPTGEVVSFKTGKNDLANNSRMTQIVIDRFNKPSRFESDYWVGMYGKNNRFDHNHLVGKTNIGVTMAVRLNAPESQENGHRIDHNYFGPRQVLGSNGGETLRIGTSKYSMHNSNSVVENNYFERCDGEVEIISSKSGGNIFRGNVFFESSGTLTLRHGDNNIVERNVFMGNGKDHTGGIRVINRNQTVRANYMEGLRGDGFASALTVMNGVPNSPVNRYVQVSGAVIENNSVLGSARFALGAGADEERSAAPVDTRFTNNLLTSSGAAQFVRVDADISGIAFEGNLTTDASAASVSAGIVQADIELKRAANGLLYPVDARYADVGVPADLDPVKRSATGVSWYPKPEQTARFGTGRRIEVEPGEGTITTALAGADDGDVLSLQSGEYLVSKILRIDKAITFAGPTLDAEMPTVTLRFNRATLFKMDEGGSLRLENIAISGADAPDSVGNAVLRTADFPMQSNFDIEFDHLRVSDLNVNRSFDVIKFGKNTFADTVALVDSHFHGITGAVVNASAETDDYGRYNVEYLTVKGSHFEDINAGFVTIYRGGRDESTFGPHVLIDESIAINVGLSSQNPSGGVVYLHGVQDAKIVNSSFENTAPIVVAHTVGTPVTVISANRFIGTLSPIIKELNYTGPQRAIINGNTQAEALQ